MTDSECAERDLSAERLRKKARQHGQDAERELQAGNPDEAAHAYRHAAQYAEALSSLDAEVTQQ